MVTGFKQRVKAPTRDDHLLDLVLSDIEPTRVSVLNKISDHNIVLAVFDFGVPDVVSVCRTVFDYKKANWSGISSDLCALD